MAKTSIIWTDEARAWLRDIWAYIATDNPRAADKTIQGILDKVQILARHPEAGFSYALPGRDDVRVLIYGHYRIAYVVTDHDSLYILGVFHAALDIDRYFPEKPR
jgi:plasmid stabilization system protein ParE